MKDFKFPLQIGIFLLFFVLIIVISELYQTSTFLKNKNWALTLESRRNKERLQECKKYPLFEQAVSKIGDRTKYDLEDYNCVDFSKDLVKELEEIGIKSNIAISDDRSHAWVLVWIETITGKFVRPEKALGILELRDQEMNVICK
ncbi:hypothetical protein KAU19_08115 [Candidatus Parcubacteria bacterium]|nr:hypothetical protein [Candidatus Parcubacteria bacterium]